MRSQVWNWNVESPSVDSFSCQDVMYVHNCHSLDSQCSPNMIQTQSNHFCHTYLSLPLCYRQYTMFWCVHAIMIVCCQLEMNLMGVVFDDTQNSWHSCSIVVVSCTPVASVERPSLRSGLPDVAEQPNQPMKFNFPKRQFSETKSITPFRARTMTFCLAKILKMNKLRRS